MTKDQDPNITGKKPQNPPTKRNPALEAKRAQNLRDNLLKRKQQMRARAETGTESEQDQTDI